MDVARLIAGTACCAWLVILALLGLGLCWIAARGDRGPTVQQTEDLYDHQ